MATSLEPSEKGVKSPFGNLQSNTYRMMKIGLMDPERALLDEL